MPPTKEHWVLDKKVPLAIVIALGLQTVGMIIWGAKLDSRVAQLEIEQASTKGQDGRIIRVETRLEGIADVLDRMDAKLDRLTGPTRLTTP